MVIVILITISVFIRSHDKIKECDGLAPFKGAKPPHSLLNPFNGSNYAATAGATRATGKDSPAARSRGKL